MFKDYSNVYGTHITTKFLQILTDVWEAKILLNTSTIKLQLAYRDNVITTSEPDSLELNAPVAETYVYVNNYIACMVHSYANALIAIGAPTLVVESFLREHSVIRTGLKLTAAMVTIEQLQAMLASLGFVLPLPPHIYSRKTPVTDTVLVSPGTNIEGVNAYDCLRAGSMAISSSNLFVTLKSIGHTPVWRVHVNSFLYPGVLACPTDLADFSVWLKDNFPNWV